jgi:tetratricopeptide (TPR) repeat protein
MEGFRLRGWAHEISGEFDAAYRDYLAELHTAIHMSDRYIQWDALIRLAELWAGRDNDRAGEYIEQTLTVAEEIGAPSLRAFSLNRLGNWYLNREDPGRAQACHNEALEIFHGLSDRSGIAATEYLEGHTTFIRRDPVGPAARPVGGGPCHALMLPAVSPRA